MSFSEAFHWMYGFLPKRTASKAVTRPGSATQQARHLPHVRVYMAEEPPVTLTKVVQPGLTPESVLAKRFLGKPP
jgi:hypothetical protein